LARKMKNQTAMKAQRKVRMIAPVGKDRCHPKIKIGAKEPELQKYERKIL